MVINYRNERGTQEVRDTLLAVRNMVHKRLSAKPGATSPIHSIYIIHAPPESEILASETLNTLKLLVPELVLHKFDMPSV